MNTGQMLMTIGALAILSTIVLSMNRTYLNNETDMLKTEIGITAVSLATSVIEEANGKAFDKATDTMALAALDSLTLPSKLGPEAGEKRSTFNDFDDYNNLDTTLSYPNTGKFRITAKVFYTNPAKPDSNYNVKSWYKNIRVTVSSPSMKDTVKMGYVFSYFFFR
jgi:hypothetical protein